MSRYINSFESDTVVVGTIDENYDLTLGNGLTIGGVLCKSGCIGVADGSAAAPGISFVGDATTGLYRHAANTLGLSVGGNSKLRIGSAGMTLDSTVTGFTINSVQESTSPSIGALVVTGGCGIGGNLYVGGTFNYIGTLTSWGYTVSDGSAALPGFTFATDTNTGIYRPAASQLGFSSGGTLRLGLSTTAASFASSITTTTFGATTVSSSTSTGALVTLGGIGIAGNLTITGALNYSGSLAYSGIATTLVDNNSPSYRFTSNTSCGWGLGSTYWWQESQYNQKVLIMEPSNEDVYVGYTTTSPSYFRGTFVGGRYQYTLGNYSTVVGNNHGVNTNTASTFVGYGTVSSGSYSTVIGLGAYGGDYSTAIGYSAIATYSFSYAIGYGAQTSASHQCAIGYPSVFGQLRCDLSSGAWSTSSDEQLKTGIVPITNALPFVLQLNPVRYKWLDGRNDTEWHGFTYQKVQHALTECGMDPQFDALKYDSVAKVGSLAGGALIPHVVAAMVELESLIAGLGSLLHV